MLGFFSDNRGVLFETIYVSAAKRLFADAELSTLLDQSRTNNERDGITGMLLYSDGVFLQILEGPESPVRAALSRIMEDKRHRGIILLTEEATPERSFDNWTMGFARASQKDLLALKGSNDFFASGKTLREMEPGRAKRLLQTFRRSNP
ncbi:BLUF domain-containing protein [bacterium]|nr:MAG: BLUF domain-containing protein [bacterium]